VTLPIFSLPHLISPAFRKEVSADQPVTIVVTEIGSQSGWLSDDVRAEQSHRVREVLQHCLQSDLDILMPKMGATGGVELFFIVALTDWIGGEAISKRIRERLQEHVRQAGLTVSTSYQLLPPVKRKSKESVEEHLERLGAGIQELIYLETSSRMVVNG
jgi:hypothetical protein